MTHTYSSENHDWDLTLAASGELLGLGQYFDETPTTGTLSKGFACFTGSMLLSFCAIESFSASIAFSMPGDERFKDFDFQKYKQLSRFWDKMEMLCSAIEIEIDKSQGLFQKIGKMQIWRNLVTHASPYDIPATIVADTVDAPTKLHKRFGHKQYTRMTDVKNAEEFYRTAIEYIELIKTRSGANPRTTRSYKAG